MQSTWTNARSMPLNCSMAYYGGVKDVNGATKSSSGRERTHLARLAEVVRRRQARTRRQDDVDLAHEPFARVVQAEVLDRGHERREAREEVRDALVFLRWRAAARQFADVLEECANPFDDDCEETAASGHRERGAGFQQL